MSAGHHHHNHFLVAGKRELMLWVAFGLTAGFMVVEFVAGIWAGSLALVADAIHMLADAGALGLALFAVRLSTRHADDHRTFGYGRMQVLAAFINGLLVLGLSIIIWKEAFKRFWHPTEVAHDTMLWVAVGGLLVNLVIMLMLHTSGSKSVNIKAAMMHVMGDALGSVTVIIAALSIGYFGLNIIDAIASLVVSLFIAYSAKNILAESGHILLEGRPPTLKLDEVSAAIKEAVPEVEGIHHLHAWSLSGEDLLATMHASVNAASTRSNDDILHDIKYVLQKYTIHHSTVQIEREGCADARGDGHTHHTHEGEHTH